MATDNVLERILKRDRLVVLAGLVAVTVIAWSYLIARFTTTNTIVDGMAEMAQLRPWTAVDAVLMWVMWVVMMISMMVPSAAPVILLYARVWRRRSTGGQPLAPISAFFSGYIAVWAVFSTAATALQWALERAALLSPMLMGTSPLFGGLILIAAGVYQWTPSKHICLSHCRSPVDFLAAHWRRR